MSISDNIEKYGFKKSELLNKPFTNLFTDEVIREIENRALDRMEDDQDLWDDDFELLTPNAGIRNIHAVAFRQINEDGTGKIVGYFKDTTDYENQKKKYKSALSYLKSFNEQYKNVIDKVAIVAQTDIKGNITHVNDKFCEITGFKKEELIGQNHRLLKSDYHPKEFYKEMWKTISGGNVWHGEICNKRKDGSLYWVDSTFVPLKSPEGKIVSYMAVRFDITERKLQEEVAQEELAQKIMTGKLAAMGEVAATLAHEVKNPLTVIQGNALRLEKKEDFETKEKALSILESSERIINIMKGIKLIARDTSQDEKEWFSLQEIINSTYHYVHHRFRRENVDLIIEDISPSLLVYCRPSDISQVILNLVNNAFDEVSAKENSWIKISTNQLRDEIEIKVTDSGTGIEPEIVSKIFSSFFTTKPQGKGTGLGLSLSQNIMNEHNSSIQYCEKEKNTTFKFSLLYKVG